MKKKPLLAGTETADAPERDAVLQPFKAAPASTPGYKRIDLEYPVHPKPRWLKYGRAGERLMAKLATCRPAAKALVERVAGFHEQFMAIPVEAPSSTSS